MFSGMVRVIVPVAAACSPASAVTGLQLRMAVNVMDQMVQDGSAGGVHGGHRVDQGSASSNQFPLESRATRGPNGLLLKVVLSRDGIEAENKVPSGTEIHSIHQIVNRALSCNTTVKNIEAVERNEMSAAVFLTSMQGYMNIMLGDQHPGLNATVTMEFPKGPNGRPSFHFLRFGHAFKVVLSRDGIEAEKVPSIHQIVNRALSCNTTVKNIKAVERNEMSAAVFLASMQGYMNNMLGEQHPGLNATVTME